MKTISAPILRRKAILAAAVAATLALGQARAQTAPATTPTTTDAVEAAAATAPATSPATSTAPATQPQIQLTPDMIPPADSFQVFDLPSDDGSGIIVKWGKPAVEPNGLQYVIQVAESPEDFQAGKFKTKEVSPTPGSLIKAAPQYFGYGADANQFRFAIISPGALFGPAASDELTPERLRKFAKDGVITSDQLTRALAALKIEQKLQETEPAGEPDTAPATLPATGPALDAAPALPQPPTLTPAEEAQLKWFQPLAAYLRKRMADEFRTRRDEIKAQPYFFRLAVRIGDKSALVANGAAPVTIEAVAKANFFKWGKLNNLILSLVFIVIVLAFIELAKHRPGLFIRKIAGLEAIDEAVGRATEMDRPVYFVHGLQGVSNLATIAAVNILSNIAHRTAEHDTRLRVMNIDPIVTAVSQEVVQQACTEAGRPDAYNPDDVSLVGYDQFSYVAAVAGSVVREQPGALFYLGSFAAESLLLAETGATTGAIQVAGTEQYTQLPFFITTCDYTLIGEELFAASAYLSREPRLLGSLRGQDVGKAFIMAVMVLGTILLTIAMLFGLDLDWLRNLIKAAG